MLHKSFFITLVCATALVLSSCGNRGSAKGIFTFDGKPVSQLLGSSVNEVIKLMGDPVESSADEDGVIHRLDYDGIHLWFDDDIFVRAESFDLSLLAIDGLTLNKNRTELIEAFGKPAKEGRQEGYYGAENAYVMLFNLSNGIILLEFEEDLNVPPYMINVQEK